MEMETSNSNHAPASKVLSENIVKLRVNTICTKHSLRHYKNFVRLCLETMFKLYDIENLFQIFKDPLKAGYSR